MMQWDHFWRFKLDIKIITVGKLKEKYWKAALDEYLKRLGSYGKVQVIEVSEEKAPANSSLADEAKIREEEGRRILGKINQGDYVITLEVGGKSLSSEELAEKIDSLLLSGRSKIAMIIGGSTGLGGNILKRSDFPLSFSKMTFPHQMMRVILLEQIYRSCKINKGETYHK